MTIEESSKTTEFGKRVDGPPPAPIVPKSASEALRPEVGTPPPARRSRGSRNQVIVFLNFLVSTILLLAFVALGVAFYGKYEFERPGPATTASTVLIKDGSGVNAIANQLERLGLISDARVFFVGTRVMQADGALKAGEYEIKAGASMRDIVEVLKSGKSLLYSLTIPEGLTVEQAFSRIAQNEALSGEMPAAMPIEGSLAADTQRFTRGMPRQQLVDKLIADQKKLVDEVWQRRISDLPIANVDEFITLASIVEKETGRADERPRVAAVFINRLKQGMRLQSDPTIVYGIYGGKGKPSDKVITQSDLDKKTPYNTYQINGLPPTPIANPGRAALEAVANPSQTDELYFVADGTGGHAFAKTLAEHNDNVARWREIEKQRAKEAADAAAAGGNTQTGEPAPAQ